MNLFLPCLLFSNVGANARLILTSGWVMCVYALFLIAFGIGLGRLALGLLKPNDPVCTRIFMCCAGFNNAVAFPMVLMSALCISTPQLAEDATCSEKAVAYISLFQMCWTLLYWSFGYSYMIDTPDPAAPSDPENGSAPTGVELDQLHAEKDTASLLTERAPVPNQAGQSSGARRSQPLAVTSWSTAGELPTLAAAAQHTEAQPPARAPATEKPLPWGSRTLKFVKQCLTPPIRAALLGIAVGLTPGLRAFFFGDSGGPIVVSMMDAVKELGGGFAPFSSLAGILCV
eukprot:TRINITY_DN3529_c0_g1_i1.p1 TRINITY_DN3529_c0_g1~~TRINITY_DN3529_c0_g1_i1.p1  ORF type:complete len:333 (-),score=64.74 TRINITY_DN3529_c0_g1_i1:479-1339(-)